MLRPVPPKEMFGNNGTIESKIWSDMMKEEVRVHDLAVRAHPSAESFVSDHRERTALRHSAQPDWFQQRDAMTINCSRSVEELFNEEVRCFVKSIRPTTGEHALRYFVIDIVRQRCVDVYGPAVVLNPFGSTATQMYLSDGDIDLEVRVPSNYTRNVRPLEAIKKSLSDLRLALARDHQLTRECSLVMGARVPILKLKTTTSFGSFAIDICVNQPKGPGGAVMCMAALNILSKPDRLRVSALLLLLKCWLRSHRFHEVRDGGLGGLSAFCMVLHYIQMDPCPEDDGADEEPQMRLGSDWIKLLRYYAEEFDYDEWCISIHGTGTVYIKHHLFQTPTNQFRISIQHPVELKRDLASGSFRMDVIRQALKDTYLDLIEYLDQPLNLLQQRYRRLLEPVGVDLPASTLFTRSTNAALIQDLVARGLMTVADEPVNPLSHPREGLSWTIAMQLHIKALRKINDEDERRLDREEQDAYRAGTYRDPKQDLVVLMDRLAVNGEQLPPRLVENGDSAGVAGTAPRGPIYLPDSHKMPRLKARLKNLERTWRALSAHVGGFQATSRRPSLDHGCFSYSVRQVASGECAPPQPESDVPFL